MFTTSTLAIHVEAILSHLRKDVVESYQVEPGFAPQDSASVKVKLTVSDEKGKITLPFYVTYNDYQAQGKLRVQGDYTEFSNFLYILDVPKPDINLSPTKAPIVAAADISRRFLEPFRPIVEKLIVRKAENAAYVARVNSNVDELLSVPGVRLVKRSEEKDGQGALDFYRRDNLSSGDIQVFEKSVNLKLNSVPIDRAKLILEILLAEVPSIVGMIEERMRKDS
jgi:hypothetical protein